MRNCVCVAAGCVLLADTLEGIYLLSCVTVSLPVCLPPSPFGGCGVAACAVCGVCPYLRPRVAFVLKVQELQRRVLGCACPPCPVLKVVVLQSRRARNTSVIFEELL